MSIDRSTQTVLALLALFVLASLAVSRSGGGDAASAATIASHVDSPTTESPRVASEPAAAPISPVSPVSPVSSVYFTRADGAVYRVSTAAADVADAANASPDAPQLVLPPPVGGTGVPDYDVTIIRREIALDASTQVLWYSDSHALVRSINLVTLKPGPTLDGFGDVALFGCSVLGQGRPIVIDSARHWMFVPQVTGALMIVDVRDLSMVDVIGPQFFGPPVIGAFRHFAVDSESGLAWFSSQQGDLVEFDPATSSKTGRVVSFEAQSGVTPTADREFFIDPASNALVYLDATGELASVDLDTLTPIEVASYGVPASESAVTIAALRS